MDILLLRFDAPLMSFGGVMVDQHGPTERFPGLSLLAGLCGNALGYSHADADQLEALQARLEYAARWDIEPEALLDYHTVDLGQAHLREPGWTTHGEAEHRGGGPDAKFGTHIRYRHYWANGVMTVALRLLPAAAQDSSRPGVQDLSCTTPPSLDDLAAALQTPARPLFLGRKTCLPAAPIFLKQVEADNVLDALRHLPLVRRSKRADWHKADSPQRQRSSEPASPPLPAGEGLGVRAVPACWPAHLGAAPGKPSRSVPIYDRRDWRNQIHAGRRIRIEGVIEVPL